MSAPANHPVQATTQPGCGRELWVEGTSIAMRVSWGFWGVLTRRGSRSSTSAPATLSPMTRRGGRSCIGRGSRGRQTRWGGAWGPFLRLGRCSTPAGPGRARQDGTPAGPRGSGCQPRPATPARRVAPQLLSTWRKWQNIEQFQILELGIVLWPNDVHRPHWATNPIIQPWDHRAPPLLNWPPPLLLVSGATLAQQFPFKSALRKTVL